jgi:hypothetical protein
LTDYPNPVEAQFGTVRWTFRIALALLLTPLVAFAGAFVSGNPQVGALGLFLLISTAMISFALISGARRTQRQTPLSIEIQEEKLIVHRDPRRTRPADSVDFVLQFADIVGVYPSARGRMPYLTFSEPLRSRWEIAEVRGAPKGSGWRHLALTRENEARIEAAVHAWKSSRGAVVSRQSEPS